MRVSGWFPLALLEKRGMPSCGQCGKAVPPDDKFCGSCGSKVAEPRTSDSESAATRNQAVWLTSPFATEAIDAAKEVSVGVRATNRLEQEVQQFKQFLDSDPRSSAHGGAKEHDVLRLGLGGVASTIFFLVLIGGFTYWQVTGMTPWKGYACYHAMNTPINAFNVTELTRQADGCVDQTSADQFNEAVQLGRSGVINFDGKTISQLIQIARDRNAQEYRATH